MTADTLAKASCSFTYQVVRPSCDCSIFDGRVRLATGNERKKKKGTHQLMCRHKRRRSYTHTHTPRFMYPLINTPGTWIILRPHTFIWWSNLLPAQLFSLMYSLRRQRQSICLIHSRTEAIAHHLINIQWHKHSILHKLSQIVHLLPTISPLG